MGLGAASVPCSVRLLVGLDIGSSAVKAVALRRGRAAGRSSRPAKRRCRTAAVQGRRRRRARRRSAKPSVSSSTRSACAARECRRALSGHAVIVKTPLAADDERGRAGRSDSLGGRAVHSVRPQRSPARLPGASTAERPAPTAKPALDVLLVAAKQATASTIAPASSRRRAAGPSSSTSRRSRSPTPIR